MSADADNVLLDALSDMIELSDPETRYFILLIKDCQKDFSVYITAMTSNLGHDDLKEILSDVLADDAEESPIEATRQRRLDS